MKKKKSLIAPPDSEPELKRLSRVLIQEAGVAGMLPTPIEVLYKTAEIVNIAELPEEKEFLKTLSEDAKRMWIGTKQKLRGIADLKTKITYTPKAESHHRDRFVKVHELSHQIIDWHNVDNVYLDDDETLSPAAKHIFEREANFLGADLLFQGELFKQHALDYTPSLDTPLHLAELFDTSGQATIWKYLEILDESAAVAMYYPNNRYDLQRGFKLWKTACSSPFLKKFSETEIPEAIEHTHPWANAADFSTVMQGSAKLPCMGENLSFEWSSWYNGYTLFIMLRRKPRLGFIGDLTRGTKKNRISKKLLLQA